MNLKDEELRACKGMVVLISWITKNITARDISKVQELKICKTKSELYSSTKVGEGE